MTVLNGIGHVCGQWSVQSESLLEIERDLKPCLERMAPRVVYGDHPCQEAQLLRLYPALRHKQTLYPGIGGGPVIKPSGCKLDGYHRLALLLRQCVEHHPLRGPPRDR